MNFSFIHKVVLLGIGCLLTQSLAALEFRVLSWKGEIEGLAFRNGTEAVAVTGGEHALSPVYTIEGTGPLKLYRTITHDEKTVEQTVLTLARPEGMSRALLLLSPIADGEGNYRGRWFDDSAESNPAGTLRVYNFSSHPLTLKVGGKQVAVTQQGTERFTFDAMARKVPVQAAAYVGGEWKLAVSMSQPVRAKFRVMMILRDGRVLTDEQVRLIDVVTVYDIPQTPPVSLAAR